MSKKVFRDREGREITFTECTKHWFGFKEFIVAVVAGVAVVFLILKIIISLIEIFS